MKAFKTKREEFWAGKFGDNYIKRNYNARITAGNISMFSKILDNARGINTAIEFGSNIGLNLIAIKTLLPNIEVSAIEINKKAVDILKKILGVKIYHKSILEFKPDYKRDFVLIKGVLIHINPDMLSVAYHALYKTSKKYILIAEYYNPTPISIDYHGHKDKLFKRDFAGEMLDKFKDLRLVNYGFTYHRDNHYDFGDINWFLLEKNKITKE